MGWDWQGWWSMLIISPLTLLAMAPSLLTCGFSLRALVTARHLPSVSGRIWCWKELEVRLYWRETKPAGTPGEGTKVRRMQWILFEREVQDAGKSGSQFPGIPHASSACIESTCAAGDPSPISGWGRSAGEEIGCLLQYSWASLMAQTVKNPPAMWETWVPSLGCEDPLEEGIVTHSSILAWRILWTAEPGGLQSMGLQRVEHY